MPNVKAIYADVMSKSKDHNMRFSDIQKLLEALDFSCRVKGDHFIYTRQDVREIINIQPVGNKAKSYQVRQIRDLIYSYNLEV